MPLDFLSTPERLRYHAVPTIIQEPDLRQFFHLTPADREFLRPFRRAANRLGIGLQLGLIRFMGFLPDTWREQLPTEAVSFVAQQQRVEPDHLKEYGARQPTRSEHFTAILKHLGFRKWGAIKKRYINRHDLAAVPLRRTGRYGSLTIPTWGYGTYSRF